MTKLNARKAAVIGCGFVGATVAYTLMQTELFSELVLVDVNKGKAEGEALDLIHGLPFAHPMQIYAGDYNDIADAAVVVMTAGANQKPGGETRLELVKRNAAIMYSISKELKKVECQGTMIVVANPVDILTYIAIKHAGFKEGKVIGSGTNLDTARFKTLLGEALDVDPRSVHGYIIGEHGDSEVAVYSSANVSGVNVDEFAKIRGIDNFEEMKDGIAYETKAVAYEIIDKKRATYYAIAMSVKRIVTAICHDEKSVLPVSYMMNGEYGINDICMSLPTVLGQDGVLARIPISLNEKENQALHHSADVLKEILQDALTDLY